jgi:hypothetical protein
MSPSLQSVIGVPHRGRAAKLRQRSRPGGVCDYGSSAADLGRGCGETATLKPNYDRYVGQRADARCLLCKDDGLSTDLSHDQRERMPGTCRRMSADGRSRAYIADSIHSDRHGANVGPIGARGGTQRAESHPQASAAALASRGGTVTRKITRPLRRVQRAELVVAAAADTSRAPNAFERRCGARPSKISDPFAGGNLALSKAVVLTS